MTGYRPAAAVSSSQSISNLVVCWSVVGSPPTLEPAEGISECHVTRGCRRSLGPWHRAARGGFAYKVPIYPPLPPLTRSDGPIHPTVRKRLPPQPHPELLWRLAGIPPPSPPRVPTVPQQSPNQSPPVTQQSPNSPPTVPQQSPESCTVLLYYFCVFVLEICLRTFTRSTASKFASGWWCGNVQQQSGAKVMADLLFGSAA